MTSNTLTPAQLTQRRANVAAIAKRRRGVRATHCERGHELSPSNVYVYIRQRGGEKRECLTCKLDRQWYRYRAGSVAA